MADFTGGSVLYASQLETAFNTFTERAVVTTTATLGAADAGELLSVNNNSGGTVTIPLNSTWAAETGTHVTILNAGTAGTWTIGTAVGVTLEGTTTTLSAGAAATVLKRGTNTWRSLPFSTGSAPATVSGTTGSPTVTTVGSTTVYKWTGNGSITTTAGTARVVVVGGGAGGWPGNTAGGGGFVLDCIVNLTAATHTITVGAGSSGDPAAGARAGESSVGSFALASGGIAAAPAASIAGRSQYDGSWASGGGGGSRAASASTTGGAGLTSTVADGSTSVEYGRGGDYSADVASPANTGRGGDAAAGTSKAGGDGVVFVVIG